MNVRKDKVEEYFNKLSENELNYLEIMTLSRLLMAYAESMQHMDLVNKAVAGSMFENMRSQ